MANRLHRTSALIVILLSLWCAGCSTPPQTKPLAKVRLSVAPFQDTLLPIIGEKKGWYKEAGLDVEIKLLPWYSGQEALAAGSVDIGMGNISSVIGAHHNSPQNVYAYGFDIFDNGFAIMIRKNSGMKPASAFQTATMSAEQAARAAILQLRGKSVITTAHTDMEQVVSYAVHAAGMEMYKDVKIIDIEPDEGLAAFLRGTGDAYLGGIPQRARALKEGHLELVSGPLLGPAEINGLVTTKTYLTEHREEVVKLLNVIFRIIDYTNHNLDDSAQIIAAELNKNTAAKFTVEDFKKYWNNYEHYMASPEDSQQQVLNSASPVYWKRRWDDTNSYFLNVAKSIPAPVDPADAFYMESVQQSYIQKFRKR
jgi:NitT/TauT family transport system substrate-binding protein